jgi:hypothetical protein
MEREDIKQKSIELISDYEDFIRGFIISALKDAYYGDWLEGIPNKSDARVEGMLNRWKKRRKGSLDKGTSIHLELICHADFSDYKQIIEYRKNWRKIFSDIFLPSNKIRLLVYMEDITNIRNKISHLAGDVSEEELYHIRYEVNWIKSKAGGRFPNLLTDRGFDTKREKASAVDLEKVSPGIQMRFDQLINICVINIEDGNQEMTQDSLSEIATLVEKEIDRSKKDHVLFVLQESFLKIYEYFYKHPTNLRIYSDLIDYAYKQNKQLAIDIVGAFGQILYDEAHSTENIEKVEPLADLLLNVGLAFLSRDHKLAEVCIYTIDDSSEMMWSSALFSKLVIAGAKLVQIENPSQEIEKLKDQVIRSIEYNDHYAKGERYLSYLDDAISYLDIESQASFEKGIREFLLNEFYSNYLQPMMDRNMHKRIEEYVDFLEDVSYDPERDNNYYFDDFEEFLSDIYEAYEDDYGDISKKIGILLADKTKGGKNPELNKMLEEFSVIGGSLVSDLILESK